MVLAVGVLLGILFFGLRPKGLRPWNAVRLNPDTGMMSIGRHGIAFVDDARGIRIAPKTDALTIEMAVHGGYALHGGFGMLLMMHDGKDADQLIIGQYRRDLIVMNGDDYEHIERRPRLSAKHVFSRDTDRLITITAGEQGTRLYIDGELIDADRHWRLSIPTQGPKLRVVLGNSVQGTHNWIGGICGTAVYGLELSPETAKRHFLRWTADKRFPTDATDALLALYTFNDPHGRNVFDRIGRNPPIQVPPLPIVLSKRFLRPPWQHFKLDRSLFSDAFINLVGFIPLGVVLYAWLGNPLARPRKHLVPAIVAFCFLLSLSIEILQAWLPTRSSSLLDLVLNTFGAWVGTGLAIWYFNHRRPIGG